MTTEVRQLDTSELKERVQRMYEEVALEPEREFHFETGRPLAERLGYAAADLDAIPAAAIDSFAGVGCFLDLAALQRGETVLDLGSGSGMDSFLAANQVGAEGRVIGVDMTDAQLAKARRLAADGGFGQADFREGFIETPPVDDGSVDCVISNGVINLSPDKPAVFAAAARALRPGGRLALSDIVTEHQLPEGVTCDAACGRRASAARCSTTPTATRSRTPASRSPSGAPTPPTASSPSALTTPPRSTASRASP